MDKFTVHRGVAAPLMRINVDTDAIIPSREMKRVSKVGLGEGLFAGWRYTEPGGRTPNPDFVLNKPEQAGTSILLSGTNFGCGSSREHAVWALKEFGIRAIIAPSFGSIFQNNCILSGLLPVPLPDESVRRLAATVELDPQRALITIDLENKVVIDPQGVQYPFEVGALEREMLLEGLDPIGLTLKNEKAIVAFEEADVVERPWIYFAPPRPAGVGRSG